MPYLLASRPHGIFRAEKQIEGWKRQWKSNAPRKTSRIVTIFA